MKEFRTTIGKAKAFKFIVLLSIALSLNTGCRKDGNADQEFGTAKLSVDCAGKCRVTYTVAEAVNNADIEKTQATYNIKYKRNYALKVSVTPIDVEQKIVVNVFSRETKQIYHNATNRKVNDTWSAQILVP